MDKSTLRQARTNLIEIGLIAYQSPLYQVLDLNKYKPTPIELTQGRPRSLGQILRQIKEDKNHD